MSTPPPPQDPYRQQGLGQQQGYGQPPQWPSAPPLGAGQSWAPAPAGDVRGRPLAEYAQRVWAWLIDTLIAAALQLPGVALILVAVLPAAGDPTPAEVNGGLLAIGILLAVVGVLIAWWNQGWRQGVTGQSWGKQARRIRLVSERDGEPIGGGLGLARFLIRALISGVVGVYWLITVLWPLWDDKRQTLEDKMLKTLVVSER